MRGGEQEVEVGQVFPRGDELNIWSGMIGSCLISIYSINFTVRPRLHPRQIFSHVDAFT